MTAIDAVVTVAPVAANAIGSRRCQRSAHSAAATNSGALTHQADGGLLALALGTATSYVALGFAAALAYTGLKHADHRALVAEDFEDALRPRTTSAQELATLLGGVAAVALAAC